MADDDPVRPFIVGLGHFVFVVGVLLLLQEVFALPIDWSVALPGIAVAVGVSVLFSALRPPRCRRGS